MHPQIGAFIERRSLRSKKTLAHKGFPSISSPFVFFRTFLLLEFFTCKKFFGKAYKKQEKYIMVRNLENSMSNNSNIQDVGPRRSTRLNVALGEMAPLPRGSTMGTTAVTTRDEVHGTTAAIQASHSRAPRVEQSAPAAKPAHAAQPAPKPAPAARPPVVSQAARVVPGINHLSTAQEGVFLSSSSNLSGEQYLSRQVMELTSALAQQTTLVNRLLQRTEIQRAPDELSRSRTRADEEPFQQRPGKQPINQTEQSGGVQSRLGPRDSVDSRLSARRSVHSRLGPRVSIRSRLGPHVEEPREQPSRQSVHSRLGPQGTYSTSPRRMPHDARGRATTRSASSSTGSPRRDSPRQPNDK